jgi:hypothetical protein
MFSRRIILAMLSAIWILAAAAGPVAAAKPAREVAGERPLTKEERAASDRKLAAAQRYLSSPEARAAGRATLACVTPDGAVPRGSSSGEAGTDGLGAPSTNACEVPNGFLPVSARDQIRGHYCGPAVGQVIANYSWAVPLQANKYTQGQIAAWMRTNENGGTSAFTMEDGLEIATARAPRRPANWDWVVSPLSDSDRDGTVGDQLHDVVRTNVTVNKMAVAIPVLPHDARGRFHLSSWPKPVSSPGHWIAAYGWRGMYDGTDSSRLFYTDSSKDEGGATGVFWDPMRHIGGMIMDHTKRFVW